MKWFVVIGRVEYDDEDTASVFWVENKAQARSRFTRYLRESSSTKGLKIYVNYIIECDGGAPILHKYTGQ